MKLKLLGLTALFAGISILGAAESFAQNNAAPIQQTCSSKVMCVLQNGTVLDPNTPAGYSCNDGHAQAVTTCHSTAKNTGGLPKGTPKPIKVQTPPNAAPVKTGQPSKDNGGDNKH